MSPSQLEAYYPRVRAIIRGMLYDRPDVWDDIAQSVMLHAIAARETFDGRCTVQTWIYRITINEVYDYLRKLRKARVIAIPLSDLLNADLAKAESCPTPQADAETRLATREVLYRVLATIPPADRRLVLAHADGADISTIARENGMNVGTVKSRLFRARERMQAELSRIAA